MAADTHSQTSEPSELVVPEVAPPPSAADAATNQDHKQRAKKSNLGSALAAEAAAEAEEGQETAAKKAVTILQAVSLRDEANLAGDLLGRERKALEELKRLLQGSLEKNELSPPPPSAVAAAAAKAATTDGVTAEGAKTTVDEHKAMAEESEALQEPAEPLTPAAADDDGAKTVEAIEETVVPVADALPPAVASEKEEVLIWGVPLLGDERSDTVLLKFLRARDLKPKEAMAMIKSAVLWRRAFGVEALLGEDLGAPELNKAVFMHGVDREGNPVCYNVYGELAFTGEEERKRFLRWRIQCLEKGIRELLDFRPGGVSAMVQVIDLKNTVGLPKKELRQALDLLQDNYPEFAAKQIFINVPWWYLAVNKMMSTFLTQRTRSKFVFASPSKSAETLLKYIPPERIPVQYGGLSRGEDTDFTSADAATEINLKPLRKQAIEIPVTEPCLLVWELRVLCWDVTYGAEFVPRSEDGYTVIVQKVRKFTATDEPVLKGSFKTGEAGKVMITVDNSTSKRKKLLYRFKAKSSP